MTRQTLQIARGNTAKVASYPAAPGEPFVNTDTGRLHAGNGLPGGVPAALKSEVEALIVALANKRDKSPYELVLTQELLSGDGSAAQAAINLFIGLPGRKRIYTAPGPLYFPRVIVLQYVNDLEWVAQGTDYIVRAPIPASGVLDQNYSWNGFLFIANCAGVDFLGSATIDYDNLPFTQGTITAVNGTSTFDVKVDDGFRIDFATSEGHFGVDGDGILDSGSNSNVASITPLGNRTLRIAQMNSVNGALYVVGKRVAIQHKKYSTPQAAAEPLIVCYSNRDIRWLGSYLILAAASTGVFNNYGAGTQNWSGVRIARKFGRLISANADGQQHVGLRGADLILDDPLLEGMCDDAMHVFNAQYTVTAVSGTTITSGGGDLPAWWDTTYSRVRVIAPNGASRGEGRITSTTSGGGQWSVTLDTLPAGTAPGDRILNLSLLPRKTQVFDGVIGRNWGNGLRLDCTNLMVRRVQFDRTLFAGVVAAAANEFQQGAAPSDVIVDDCDFDNCQRNRGLESADYLPVSIAVYATSLDGSGGGYAPVQDIGGVEIIRNRIRHTDGGGVAICEAHNVTASDNTFYDISRVPLNSDPGNIRRNDITLRNVSKAIIDDNKNLDLTGRIASAGGAVVAEVGRNPGMSLSGIVVAGDLASITAAGTDQASATSLPARSNRVVAGSGGVRLPAIAAWGARTITVTNATNAPILIYSNGSEYFEVGGASRPLKPAQTETYIPSLEIGWVEVGRAAPINY
ncbi:hypothetical protein DA075_10305 [Methylobacterium currus]|uniref:Major tropism determinant N-terminal domain-containing protein n=1 Tax=Methylobacterium currus TaxID=2051553 RepID=A0A2R4WI82_9HYPH|nr:hypothetical protein [Methylobacterium currus]AWB21254.1 hypothetical protein DA075_10305 [Methylobacterium currus]